MLWIRVPLIRPTDTDHIIRELVVVNVRLAVVDVLKSDRVLTIVITLAVCVQASCIAVSVTDEADRLQVHLIREKISRRSVAFWVNDGQLAVDDIKVEDAPEELLASVENVKRSCSLEGLIACVLDCDSLAKLLLAGVCPPRWCNVSKNILKRVVQVTVRVIDRSLPVIEVK